MRVGVTTVADVRVIDLYYSARTHDARETKNVSKRTTAALGEVEGCATSRAVYTTQPCEFMSHLWLYSDYSH